MQKKENQQEIYGAFEEQKKNARTKIAALVRANAF